MLVPIAGVGDLLDCAVDVLVKRLLSHGAGREQLIAKVFAHATDFNTGPR
jgi:chemotaxis receptor (MCP) glutamine deamidase CheD